VQANPNHQISTNKTLIPLPIAPSKPMINLPDWDRSKTPSSSHLWQLISPLPSSKLSKKLGNI